MGSEGKAVKEIINYNYIDYCYYSELGAGWVRT